MITFGLLVSRALGRLAATKFTQVLEADDFMKSKRPALQKRWSPPILYKSHSCRMPRGGFLQIAVSEAPSTPLKTESAFASCLRERPHASPSLRGHDNILKRLLIHLAGFNLSRLMRKVLCCVYLHLLRIESFQWPLSIFIESELV
jgi:hypothetical protein